MLFHPAWSLEKGIARCLFPLALLCILSSGSCEKTRVDGARPTSANGMITGKDGRACPCCGGFMINFTDEPRTYTGTFFLIDNDISSFGISDTTVFPVKVSVDYTVLEKCSGAYISILKLARR